MYVSDFQVLGRLSGLEVARAYPMDGSRCAYH